MSGREAIGGYVHDFLERRFGGELVDPAQFARDKGNADGLLSALNEAHRFHQICLGRTIRDHELIGVIGRGGFGEVYAATNTALKRTAAASELPRALKVVSRKQFTELSGIEEFLTKIKDFSRLVQVYEFGEAGRHYFWYTMPRADNVSRTKGKYLAKSLDTTLKMAEFKNLGLPVAAVYPIGLAIASALKHVHEVGLAHSDVKPGNILCIGNRWHLGDMGLLKSARDNVSLSGTKPYWPPEGPLRDLKKADLYALGLTLYEAVTGCRDVYRAPEEIRGRTSASLDAPVRPLWKILAKACAADPDHRYETAGDLITDLRREQKALDAPPPAKRRWLLGWLSRKKR